MRALTQATAPESLRTAGLQRLRAWSAGLWRSDLPVGRAAAGLRLLLQRTPERGALGRLAEDLTLAQAVAAADAVIHDPEAVEARLARLEAGGAVPVAIVGDSHSSLSVRRLILPDGRFAVPFHRLCTGASGRGLANPQSRSGYGAEAAAFVAALRRLRPAAPFLWQFGQVDTEFVHYFRRLEAGSASFDPSEFEAFCRDSVSHYIGYLESLFPPSTRARVFVAAIFPPALSDAAWRRGYVNAHIAGLHATLDRDALAERLKSLDIPDLARRTGAHVVFNVLLAAEAKCAGFPLLDDFDGLLGGDGLVQPRLLGLAAGHDHHLDHHAMREPMQRRLRRVLGAASPD